MTVLIIDWTGVGGIAEATRSWYAQAREVGRRPTVVTPLGGSLAGSDVIGVDRSSGVTGYARQVDIVQLAAEYIRRKSPKVVVVQGYVMPHEEQRIVTAARAVGARVVLVVYIPRPPFLARRSSIGLRKLLRSADVLVAHADHVAERLNPTDRQRVVRSPFPPFEMSAGVLGSPPGEIEVPEPKPTQLVVDVDAVSKSEVSGLLDAFADDGSWSLAAVGAPDQSVALANQRSWIDTVGESRAALIPPASPYGNIMTAVAMGLGVVPVVRDIGAQSAQIGHGRAGILVPPDARPEDWVAACEPLHDDDTVERYVGAAFDLIDQQSAEFAAAARDVLS